MLIGDLQLSEAGRRENSNITRLAGKTTRYEKTKTYFNKPSKWLKRMIVREQACVFSLFEFGFIVPAVPKCYFDIICADVA